MAKTTEEFHTKLTADNASYNKGMQDSKKHSEGFLEGERKIEGATRSMAASLGSAASAADLVAAAANSLEDTFKGSLGISIAVAAGLGLKTVLEDNAKEMNRLSDIAGGVFAQKMDTQGKSVEDLAGEMQKAKAAATEFAEAQRKLATLPGGIMQSLSGLFGGNSVAQQETQLENFQSAAEKEMGQRMKDMLTVEERRVSVAKLLAQGRDDEAAALTKAQARQKELAAAETASGPGLRDRYKEQFRLEDEAEARKKTAIQDQLKSQYAIMLAKEKGSNAEVEAAKIVQNAALDKFRKNRAPEQDQAILNEQTAARAAVADAEEKHQIALDTIELQRQAIDDQNAGDTEHLATLQREEEILRGRFNDATDDKRGQIGLDLAKNAQAQVQGQLGRQNRGLNVISGQSQAATGFGPTEQLAAMRRELEITRARKQVEEDANGFHSAQAEALTTQIKLGEKALQQAEAERVIEDAKLRAEGAHVSIEGDASSEAEKRYKITQTQLTAVEAEIRAMRGLNPELARAAELSKQRLENDLRRQDQDLNLGKSGQAVRARFREQDKAQKEVEKFRTRREADGGLIPTKRDMSGRVIEGMNPVTGKKESRVPQDDFARRFHPERFHADPFKGAKAAGAVKQDPILGKLDEVKNAILAAIAK